MKIINFVILSYKYASMSETVIYNFLDHKHDYVAKCLPFIDKMNTIGLLQDLVDVQEKINIETFRKRWNLQESDFNNYDLKLLIGSLPLLKNLIKDTHNTLNEIVNLPSEYMIYLSKIVAKKYIIYREHNVKNLKVMCNINITNDEHNITSYILVNCYYSRNDRGFVFRPIKGSVSIDINSPAEAVIKELLEEFDLKIDPRKLTETQIVVDNHNNVIFKYDITLTQKELEDHLTNMNISNIDSEITQIKMFHNKKESKQDDPYREIFDKLKDIQERLTIIENKLFLN